jgi:hypothetical protein
MTGTYITFGLDQATYPLVFIIAQLYQEYDDTSAISLTVYPPVTDILESSTSKLLSK